MKSFLMKLAAISAVLGLFAGCASQAPKEQEPARVETGKPSMAAVDPVKPAAVEQPKVTPVKPETIVANPLKDPGNVLSKRSVFYDYNSNVVKDEFKPMVTAHARYLTQNRGRKIAIQGNTDERGSREYNLALGQKRADAVRKALILLGARDDQLEAVSLGEEKPVCTEASEECWGKNRRGDMLYSGEF